MKRKIILALVVISLLCVVGWTRPEQKKTEWEYTIIKVQSYQGPGELNKAGAQGWELVGVIEGDCGGSCREYHLKRAK